MDEILIRNNEYIEEENENESKGKIDKKWKKVRCKNEKKNNQVK